MPDSKNTNEQTPQRPREQQEESLSLDKETLKDLSAPYDETKKLRGGGIKTMGMDACSG